MHGYHDGPWVGFPPAGYAAEADAPQNCHRRTDHKEHTRREIPLAGDSADDRTAGNPTTRSPQASPTEDAIRRQSSSAVFVCVLLSNRYLQDEASRLHPLV